ncbi:uncharacterized protein LOC120183069 [Hibiscus syriacus]|uniref:uncharacterized protein LOC120183069 n=1 Tax=Hibiscus syriacus TaxID=106335 RepID=UPI001921223C|nr:uncharacterized protein LOC120183069 [Hibiscus syriacus]
MNAKKFNKENNTREPRWVRWGKPPEGHFTLNTNGACSRSSGTTGVGGMIKNEKGEWITVAKSLKLRNLIMEMDSREAIGALQDEGLEDPQQRTIVEECRNIMQEIGEKEIKHILTENNRCADWLAKLAISDEEGEGDFPEPPANIRQLLDSDRKEEETLRM